MILIIDDKIKKHKEILDKIQRPDVISVYRYEEAIKIIDHFADSIGHIYLDHDFDQYLYLPNAPGTGSKIAWHLIGLDLKIPVTIISKNSQAVEFMFKMLEDWGVKVDIWEGK